MIDWSQVHKDPQAHRAGIVINAETRAGFMADLAAKMTSRQGYTVATINLDHVVKLKTDRAFLDAYAQQTYVTADGKPIVWLSRLSQHDIELLPGSEIIDPIADMAARLNVPIALFGATDESLKRSADALEKRYPGINIVCRLAPPMGFDPNSPAADECIETLKQSGARLVFLALGAPKQEIFACRAFKAMPEAGFMSIGAGLDFISGAQKRAPFWVRKLALEWFWRMARNPRRLAARYAACIAIMPSLFVQSLKVRKDTHTGETQA